MPRTVSLTPGHTHRQNPTGDTALTTRGRVQTLKGRYAGERAKHKQSPREGGRVAGARRTSARKSKQSERPERSPLRNKFIPLLGNKQTYEVVDCHPKASIAHGGRQQPAIESISRRRRRTRRIDVIMHHSAVDLPATHVADAVETNHDGRSATSGAFAKRVTSPRLTSWCLDTHAQKYHLEPRVIGSRWKSHATRMQPSSGRPDP